MLLTFTRKNDETQSMDFSAKLSDEELTYLVNFAITSLMQIGAIVVQQGVEGSQEVTLPTDMPTPTSLN